MTNQLELQLDRLRIRSLSQLDEKAAIVTTGYILMRGVFDGRFSVSLAHVGRRIFLVVWLYKEESCGA